MKRVHMQQKTVKMNRFFTDIEYGIIAYILFSSVVNFLNLAGIIHFNSWFMKPTFWGNSILVLTLLQYCLINKDMPNKRLEKIRPYAIGVSIAGIVSTCNLVFCLMLMLLIGFFLINGFSQKYEKKNAFLVILISAVGIEVYSIAFLIQADNFANEIWGFWGGLWPDLLLVIAAIVYFAVTSDKRGNRKSISAESKKASGKISHRKINLKSKYNLWKSKLIKNASSIERYTGIIICISAISIFLYYLIACEVGANVLARNGEEVFILRNYEEPSLVLTAKQENGIINLSFEKYAGTNNQKVYLRKDSNDLYNIVFLEPRCTLITGLSEDGTYSDLTTTEAVSDSINQKWLLEIDGYNNNAYRFIYALGGAPICYQSLAQGEGIPQISVKLKSGGYEVFIVEHTVESEFISQTIVKHGDEFAPTILMETLLVYLGSWIWVFAVGVTLVIFTIICAGRIIGVGLSGINMALFAYLLAYGAVSVIILFGVAFFLQCYCAHSYKKI